jgi:hypothetical protein
MGSKDNTKPPPSFVPTDKPKVELTKKIADE